uniref:Gustatory receptor n=1 Tax=Lutzomyia longipalpis TaxID=7200 RepID=A0A3F2ZDF3_LUTLO
MRKPYFKWPQPTSVYESFRPAFHFLSFCLPLSFPHTPSAHSGMSVTQILQFAFNISILIFIYIRTQYGGLKFTQLSSGSDIMANGTNMLTGFGILYITTILIIFRLMQKRITGFIVRLNDVDRRIQSLGQTINFSSEFKIFTINATILSLTIILLWIATSIVIEADSILMRIVFSYFTFSMNVTGMGLFVIVMVFMYGIRMRFIAINSAISHLFHLRASDYEACVVCLAKCHSDLIDIVVDINGTLIGYITVDFCALFCFNIMNSLSVFRLIMYGDTHGWLMKLSNQSWGIFQGLIGVFFIALASSLRRQCKRTGITIHKILNGPHTIEWSLSERLVMFSQQVRHRLATITCGFFIYDWTLWQSILSQTATFFVVIVQFDIEHERQMNFWKVE